MKIEIVKLEDAHEDARGWVLNAWLRSWEHQRPEYYGHLVPPTKKEYYKHHYAVVECLLKDGCYIAHDPGAPDLFRGFLCGTYGIFAGYGMLHYAYTKLNYRRRGVMRALVACVFGPGNSPVHISHMPPASDSAAKLAVDALCPQASEHSYLAMSLPVHGPRKHRRPSSEEAR